MIIIAIDPGGTTGWATYDDQHGKERWRCGQWGPHDHHADLYGWLETLHTQDFVLIGERFDFRGDDRSDINLMAREYIGVMKLFAQERGVDVVWQWPFEGVGKKSFVQPHNLQALKIWVVGGSSQWIHAMDAYRHLLYYMTAKPREEIDSKFRNQLLKRMGK
jgi:hypothetical protein